MSSGRRRATPAGASITGSDILVDGGVIASLVHATPADEHDRIGAQQ